MIKPQSYPTESVLEQRHASDGKIINAPVRRSEAWKALSACSFFSLAVSSFFSCPVDPAEKLIARGAGKICSYLLNLCCWACARGLKKWSGRECEEGKKGKGGGDYAGSFSRYRNLISRHRQTPTCCIWKPILGATGSLSFSF